MKNNYLLEYTSNFLYQKKVKELITKNNFGNNYCSEYDLSENSLDLVLEDLDTYSFLSEKKVILLKGIELLDIENNIIIEEYNNEDINELKEQLSTYIVTFEKINDNYIFSNIESK